MIYCLYIDYFFSFDRKMSPIKNETWSTKGLWSDDRIDMINPFIYK